MHQISTQHCLTPLGPQFICNFLYFLNVEIYLYIGVLVRHCVRLGPMRPARLLLVGRGGVGGVAVGGGWRGTVL